MQPQGVPNSMKAVVIDDGNAFVKTDVPVATYIPEGHMLIKTAAVALNTSEWKHIDYKLAKKGAIMGCDVVGEVILLGSPTFSEFARRDSSGDEIVQQEFKVGDFVYSFVHGSSNRTPDNGALAEYVVVDSATTLLASTDWKSVGKSVDFIAPGPVKSLEAAVSLPVSLTTAGGILFHDLRNRLEWEPIKSQNDFPLLVWGGATGVGLLTIQLAKRTHSYSKIIAVASKKHEALLKEFGADDVFDYHDKDVVQQIKSKYNNIQHLIDAVSEQYTIRQVYQCAADDLPVTIMQLVFLTINDIPTEIRRDNVKIISTLIYSVTGYEVKIGEYTFPPNPIYRRDVSKFINFIAPKIQQGGISNMPVKICKNGLDDVPGLIDKLRKGEVRGEKLVTIL
ncbi:similar to Saccharomyces cerevisiae YNL134C Putative protein of unknown function with similarity to dehydrogenases from other model organisms [Maudiozyma barnettii]|uniref:Enoyl reductase (ER) domain-containing protein n=1 Tax=Maudiozyma barnettii TaxID=61262 RepID=A0A8H2ZFE6_9SACH|nr:uncharacterized protein KABA2_01S10054 [Kazachstania barnettii]CAB4252280.1 similar to Saccharomyces cerevisiae YNL134C Putative protein of unknown function with similarity to dehydrogenases from other model organisms [Kazachstania barnettii]CAD1778979.1 similar to Saccharomyces cerevisiae YNL134C Putative protein of unknown function with similarity to dehydrogenases from other model organisms [Kazachstania barnettii]